MLAAEALVDPVIGHEEIEDAGHQRLAVLQLQALGRNPPDQHVRMVGAGEMIVLAVAEIGEGHVGDLVANPGKREP